MFQFEQHAKEKNIKYICMHFKFLKEATEKYIDSKILYH